MSSSPVKGTHQATPVQTHHHKPTTQSSSSHSKSNHLGSPHSPIAANAKSSHIVESTGRENVVSKRKLDRSDSNLKRVDGSNQPEKQPKISPPENKEIKTKTIETSTDRDKEISGAQKRREKHGTQDDYHNIEVTLGNYLRIVRPRYSSWLLSEPKNDDNENREEKEYEDRRCILSAIKTAIDMLDHPLRDYNLSKEQCSSLLKKPGVTADFYENALNMLKDGFTITKDKKMRKKVKKNSAENVSKAIELLKKRTQGNN